MLITLESLGIFLSNFANLYIETFLHTAMQNNDKAFLSISLASQSHLLKMHIIFDFIKLITNLIQFKIVFGLSN